MNKDSFKIPDFFDSLSDDEKLDLINNILIEEPKNKWALSQLEKLTKKYKKQTKKKTKLIYCKFCGKKIKKRSEFCKFCGGNLNDSEKLSDVKIKIKTVDPTATPNYSAAYIPKRKSSSLKTLISFGIIILIYFLYQPISDQLVIWNADPVMLALAQKSGMSREGELLFLRADPELVSDNQLQSDCSTKAANNNGFFVQGCYIPQTNKIYLREMPQDLYDVEITTAAYEMLHIAYINISNAGNASSLNQEIEDNYKKINDAELKNQVINFAKTEPDARDLELFSLLGTEYSNISSKLNSYCTPYFDDINVNVAYNTQIFNTFKSYESQLSQLKNIIDSNNEKANEAESYAQTAYNNSVSWARVGNAYQNNYNYNIYKQDIANENFYINAANRSVDKYNQLLATYNKLVTEFNGTQPTSQISNTQQAQTSQ
jgi:hypothetical protein